MASWSSSKRKPNIRDWSAQEYGGEYEYDIEHNEPRQGTTYRSRERVEEGLVGVVVELRRDGMKPDDAFCGVEVDEAERVVLFEACAFADPQGTVRVNRDAIAAKDKHASKTSRGPVVGCSAKRRVINASGYGCNNLAVGRNEVEDGPSVVVGKRGDGRGGGLRVWVGHVNVVRGYVK